MQEDEWQDIPGYEGLYQVTRDGRVRNAARGNDIKPINVNGYWSVGLFKNKVNRKIKIHRILYATFIGDIPAGNHIHHINGDRKDNRLENLQCVTFEEHLKIHSRNFKKAWKRVANRSSKLNRASVEFILDKLSDGVPVKEIAKEYNMSLDAIYRIGNGDSWKSINKPRAVARARRQTQESDVAEIFNLAHSGTMKTSEIARKFNVSLSTVRKIKLGRNFRKLINSIKEPK